MDLKSLKRKWTDITITLALPLVVWNGATGIYNKWEEVQNEKEVPRMIASQRFDDTSKYWRVFCKEVRSWHRSYDFERGVLNGCDLVHVPLNQTYEDFQVMPSDGYFIFGTDDPEELRRIAMEEYNIPFLNDTADDLITQRSAKETFDIVMGRIFNPIKNFKDGIGDLINELWSAYVYDKVS